MAFQKTVKICCEACLSVMAGVAFAEEPTAPTSWGVSDSFEAELGNHWSGNAEVQVPAVADNYPDSPAFGYPIPKAEHTQVLKVEGMAVCTNKSEATEVQASQVDFLVKVVAPDEAPDVATETVGAQIALAAWTNGTDSLTPTTVPLKLFCKPRTGGDAAAWVTLVDAVTVGTWVRVGLNFDYENDLCRVSLNGEPLVTANGFRTNVKNTNDAQGAWYQLADNPQAGNRVSEVKVIGTTQLDDFVIGNQALADYNPYVDAEGKAITEVITPTLGDPVKVPLNLIEKSGLSKTEIADGGVAPGDTLSVLAVVEAGLELGKGEKFEMKTVMVSAPELNGRQNFTITFPGANDDSYYTIEAYDNEKGSGTNLVEGNPLVRSEGNGKKWIGTVNTTGKKTIYFKLKAKQPTQN